MEKRHYVMLLNDPAQPGFCSKDKPYFGTIEHFIMVKWLMEGYTGWEATATAIGKYFLGQKPAEHQIANQKVPILRRIKVYATGNIRFGKIKWEHINIWGFPYTMHCDSGFITQIIVKYKGEYCRCLRVWFKNLCYEDTSGNWQQVESFWGNRELMLIYRYPNGDIRINNVLYIIDKKYATFDEAQRSLHDFNELSFKTFCEEIFADG